MLLASSDTPAYRRFCVEYPALGGWFITPRKRGVPTPIKSGGYWAGDNDCYNLGDKFNFGEFLAWLTKLTPYLDRCLFVPVPDVVGNWAQTIERFNRMRDMVAELDFPLAVVLQDGCDGAGSIPWSLIDAVFVGGTTEYKLSQPVLDILVEAEQRGKWRHVGRVNSKVHISHFYGFADSFDGTTFSIEPDGALRWASAHLRWHARQPRLFGV